MDFNIIKEVYRSFLFKISYRTVREIFNDQFDLLLSRDIDKFIIKYEIK